MYTTTKKTKGVVSREITERLLTAVSPKLEEKRKDADLGVSA